MQPYRHDGTDPSVRILASLKEPAGVRLMAGDLDMTADRDLFLPERTCRDSLAVWRGRSFGSYDPHGRHPAGYVCHAEYADRLLRRYADPQSAYHDALVHEAQMLELCVMNASAYGVVGDELLEYIDELRYLRGIFGMDASPSSPISNQRAFTLAV